jgi:putative transposase
MGRKAEEATMGRRGRTRFAGEANTFFITTTFFNFARVLSLGNRYYELLRDSLIFLLAKTSADLIAYVFIPSHIHLVIHVPVGRSISDFMRDFKKYTSVRIRQQLEIDGREGWIDELRRNAAGRRHEFKLWFDRFDDVVIRSERVMAIKINYIHQNPVRAGLVSAAEDWPYSSARSYSGASHDFLPVSVWNQVVSPDSTSASPIL